MSEAADNTLLMRMRRGDAAAARALHEQLGPRLLAYARALLRDDSAAEDAAQQAWLHVMTCPNAQATAVRDIAAWMVVVCRRAALSSARARQRQTRREQRVAPIGPLGVQPTSDAASLYAGVDRLDDEHREIILLRHVAALTFDQISFALDTPKSTLSSRYQAALDALRHTMHPPTPTGEVSHA